MFTIKIIAADIKVCLRFHHEIDIVSGADIKIQARPLTRTQRAKHICFAVINHHLRLVTELASLSESIYPLLVWELESETFDALPDK